MREQRSFEGGGDNGALYIVPTPIGNLDDITFRAIDTLKSADLIAAEDTRRTLQLCRHFGIETPVVSYHEHNKKSSGLKLLAAMQQGKAVALVTDAGTPGISDPGEDLVKAATEHDIRVIPLPGANAALTALVASGLSTEHFLFMGFLPRKQSDKQAALEAVKALPYTLIFYESPHRVIDTLASMETVLGDRRIALARELTKRFETFLRGTIGEIRAFLEGEDIKGECCIVVEGGTSEADDGGIKAAWWSELGISEHVDYYVREQHLTTKEAIKRVAADRKRPKRDIYNAYHGLLSGRDGGD